MRILTALCSFLFAGFIVAGVIAAARFVLFGATLAAYILVTLALIVTPVGAVFAGYVAWKRHQHAARLRELELAEAEARLERERAQTAVLRRTVAFDSLGNAALVDDYGRIVQLRGNYQAYPALATYHAPRVERISEIASSAQAAPLATPALPAPRDFADVLADFQPRIECIYLAESAAGALTSGMYDLCHVGLGGRTGGGKTNTARLLTAQLCYVGATVYLATPNFAQVKLNGRRLEDWRPIVARLAEPPAREDQDIARLLQRFKLLFERRKAQEELTPRRPRDLFLVLGELPGIMARMDAIGFQEAPTIIEILLREARQYGVHVITEFQDALVKTLRLNSGVRENLLTGFYTGGDATTAKLLLDLPNGVKVDETGIGERGAVYLRTKNSAAQPARVPFFSNRALYMLLGTPPDPMPDQDITDESAIPLRYARVVDGGYIDAPARPRTSGSEPRDGAMLSRQDALSTGYQDELIQDILPRQTGPLGALVEPTHTALDERQDGPRLTDTQAVQFVALYRLRGNIDACLKQVGCSSRYRQHARELIRLHKLESEA